jgi:DNA-binding transcriptional LysR family regulator
MLECFRGFSVEDFLILSDLDRFGSFRSLARAHHISVARVSTAVLSYEKRLGVELVRRSTVGFELTPRGPEFCELARRVIHTLSLAGDDGHGERGPEQETLTLASRNFLNAALAKVFARLSTERPGTLMRLVDCAPEELKVGEYKNAIDAALYLNEMEWTGGWSVSLLGHIDWHPFVSVDHPLARHNCVTDDDLLSLSFIAPVFWSRDAVHEGADHFPVRGRRKVAAQCQTADVAVRIASETYFCAYVPALVVNHSPAPERLVALKGPTIPVINSPVYLAVHQDRVRVATRGALETSLKQLLTADAPQPKRPAVSM